MPRVVLVTGCSQGGIGFALCEEFAEQGCKVYASSRNLETIQGFKDQNIEKLALDVTSDDDVQRVVQHILEIEGKIDVVVNNAGVMGISPLIDVSLDYAKHIFDTNTFAALRMAKAVIPPMSKRRSGLIVNIGSIVGEIPTPWNGIYSASKAALHSMSEVLSMECKPFDISVLLVAPGAVKSNVSNNQASRFSLPSDSLYKSFLHNIIERLHLSQTSIAMPSKVFAKEVVTKALRRNPPSYMTLGGNSSLFSFVKCLPRTWVFWLLWRRFSKKN